MSTSKRRIRGRVALVLIALAVLAGLLQTRTLIGLDPDQRFVSFERWKRFTAYSAGYGLPGTPDLSRLEQRLGEGGYKLGDAVFVRIFKREFEFEIYLQRDGRFERFATYPICRWSGRLGPKVKQGDRQSPEGFYTVGASALNPNSRWHRSFNLGFPNAYDRTHKRTGSFIMVHGGCSSVGCFAMTNAVVDEIWTIVTAALKNGQDRFHVHVFPFRMTEENLARRAGSPHAQFWRDLKAGYDNFETEGRPPQIGVCAGRYWIAPGRDANGSSPIAAKCLRVKSAT